MKLLKILLGVVLALVVALVGVYAYLDGFAAVRVGPGQLKATTIVYTVYRGSYQEIGPQWEQFLSDLKAKANLSNCYGLAFYLDPPETPPEETRSLLACDLSRASPEHMTAVLGHFRTANLPDMETMSATFPFKNMLSFMVGPMKVYPVLTKAMADTKSQISAAIEVYGDMEKVETIAFHMPIGVEPGVFTVLAEP